MLGNLGQCCFEPLDPAALVNESGMDVEDYTAEGRGIGNRDACHSRIVGGWDVGPTFSGPWAIVNHVNMVENSVMRQIAAEK